MRRAPGEANTGSQTVVGVWALQPPSGHCCPALPLQALPQVRPCSLAHHSNDLVHGSTAITCVTDLGCHDSTLGVHRSSTTCSVLATVGALFHHILTNPLLIT